MDKTLIINEINGLIKVGEDIKKTKWDVTNGIGFPTFVDGALFEDWFTKIKFLMRECLSPENDFYCKISELSRNTLVNTNIIIKILTTILEYEEKGLLSFEDNNSSAMSVNILYNILGRFNDIVKQLRKRYNGRPTLDVSDEYDVQDLLHAILKIFYDDVRKEEWTPSYAGKCSRQDFLIKKEQFVIEIKKTRPGLAERELGDELLVDIARYKTHQDCLLLVCFIYDPDGRISNPIGFIDDLENSNRGFVKVIINPI